MRILALAVPLALFGLGGCSATGPETYASMTGGGVGFGDYQRYLREREATRSTAPYSVPPEPGHSPILPPAAMPAAIPAATTFDAVPPRPLPPAPALPVAAGAPLSPPINTQPLAPVTAGAAGPQSTAAAPVAASLVTPAVTADAPPATIRDAQTYHPDGTVAHGGGGAGPAPAQIVAVTSVPPPSNGGPNLMAYALSATHPVGTEVYRRLNPLRWSRWETACLQFRNQDAAQIAFLQNGGPDRDRDHLDPDGDGYACWWDPAPFRQAAVAGR